MIFSIIIFVLIIIICLLYKKTKDVHSYNQDIDYKNQKLNEQLILLQKQQQEEENKIEYLKYQKKDIQKDIDIIDSLIEKGTKELKNHKDILANAFSNYCEVLDNKYEKTEEDFDRKLKELENDFSYSAEQLKAAIQKEKDELEKIRATRAAAQEALNREEEIKANMEFYCLIPSRKDLQDYDKLNSLRPMLNNGRVLSMLLWQTFYQPLAKKQFPMILGTKTITGIYKITNQLTGQAYIGQAVNIYRPMKNFSLLS